MYRKLISLFLILALAVSFFSCGSDGGTKLTNVFAPTIIAKIDSGHELLGGKWRGGEFHTAFMDGYKLCFLTAGAETTASYPEMPDAPGGGVYPQSFTLTDDGDPAVAFLISTDKDAEISVHVAVYSGTSMKSFERLEGFSLAVDFLYVGKDLTVAASENEIAVLSGGLTKIYEVGGRVISLDGGKIGYESDGKYYFADVTADGISSPTGVGIQNVRNFCFTDGIYADTADAVYLIADGKSEVVIDWKNSSVDHSRISDLFVESRDSAYYRRIGGASGSQELIKLSRVPDGKAVEKTRITLGVTIGSTVLTQAVSDFNQTNGVYHIEVADYSPSKKNADGINKLGIEIAAGNVPDILQYDSRLDLLPLERRGAFVDLSEFIESDSMLDISDFPAGIARDGKIFVLPASVTIKTMAAKNSTLGKNEKFDLDSLISVAKADPDSFVSFEDDRAGMLEKLVLSNEKSLTDEKYLGKLLEFAKNLPAEYPVNFLDEDERADYAADNFRIYRDGKSLFYTKDLRNLNDYMTQKCAFGEEYSVVGYPGEAGGATMIEPALAFLVSSGCAEKSGAWEFLHQLLTGDYYSFGSSANFPAAKSGLDRYFETAREMKFWYNPSGTAVASETKFDKNGSYEIEFRDSDEKLIRDLIENGVFAESDRKLVSIVSEDAATYFSGAKELSETVKIISDRVGTRLSELGG